MTCHIAISTIVNESDLKVNNYKFWPKTPILLLLNSSHHLDTQLNLKKLGNKIKVISALKQSNKMITLLKY